MNIIPVVHCFDDNFVLPACISFYSMLEHADKNYFYKLYVMHSDISQENQNKLAKIVNKFSNASIDFIDMNNQFMDLFSQTKNKAHYSKEIYYKFLVAKLFTQYDKAIITDVDVVFLDDISKDFVSFDVNDEYYLAGVKGLFKKDSWLFDFIKIYKNFTKEEKEKLLTGAGYWIFNLKKMRQDNMVEKFIDFALKNAKRIKQPEQDTVNLLCYPNIKLLHPKTMVCAFHYDMYKSSEDYSKDVRYSPVIVKEAIEKPVQLHYAGKKPWNGGKTKAKIWFEYLYKLDLIDDYVDFINNLMTPKTKRVCSFKLPFLKNELIILKTK